MNLNDIRIAVIGLGYVGLPLAAEFAKKFEVLGYDINESRIEELTAGYDRTLELDDEELATATHLKFSSKASDIASANVYIVTAPTPINESKQPDLTSLLSASSTVGQGLSKGDVVIFESTVYPGATEEDCVPVLEEASGLKFNEDFSVGYSPERINPGDKQHRFNSILKVTSGSTPSTAQFVDDLYNSVVTAGTYLAPSIRVAEAAKVIENTQRDVSIALINELAVLFNRLKIDTEEVLKAAGTKWNFLPFRPGLVGGHCIGVDPYYLTHKAQAVGYHPEIILAGRRLNDSMGHYVASETVKGMLKSGVEVQGARVLVLGLTFKENTPDLRNTRVVDVIRELEEYDIKVDVFDPWVDMKDARDAYGIQLVESPAQGGYAAVILAVAHEEFSRLTEADIRAFLADDTAFVYDLKGVLPKVVTTQRL